MRVYARIIYALIAPFLDVCYVLSAILHPNDPIQMYKLQIPSLQMTPKVPVEE